MKLQARDYQDFAVKSIWKYFQDGNVGNPLVAMPTGTGKSVVIALFAMMALQAFPSTKIQVITHVKELIQQNHDKFVAIWPQAPAGIFSAGLGRKDVHNSVLFGGIGSVAKKAHLFGHVDLLIIDEAHLVNVKDATMYNKYIQALKQINPMLKVIGLTATPWRAGHGSIVEDSLFTDICCDMTGVDAFNWLIKQCYLVPLVPAKTHFTLDTTGVAIRGGEYSSKELELKVNRSDITRRALKRTFEMASDRKSWLIFAAGIDHAKDIAQMLQDEFDTECGVVYSGMPDAGPGGRDDILERFKNGSLRVVVNNNILTTGFDHPGLDLIVVLRPTMSSVLWVQMLGRGTRPCFVQYNDQTGATYDLNTVEGRAESIRDSGKLNCLVLDFAGNARKLGPINDPVIPRKKGEAKGVAPVKECPVCGVENHSSARFCGGAPHPEQLPGFCGSEFQFAVKIEAEAATEDIIKPSTLPVIDDYIVNSVQYSIMARPGRHRMMSVAYQCGLSIIKELICFEHPKGNYARTKAESWWRKRSASPIPNTVPEAIDYLEVRGIATPTHLRVRTDTRYPEILAYDFNGTAFGKVAPEQVVENRVAATVEVQDADIPF